MHKNLIGSRHKEAQEYINSAKTKLSKKDNSVEIKESSEQNLKKGINSYETGSYNEAISTLNKIPENSKHYKEAQNYINLIENKLSKKNKGKITEESLEQYLLEGMKLYKIGKYEEAISVWEKIPASSKHYAKTRKYIKTAETKLIEIKNKQ